MFKKNILLLFFLFISPFCLFSRPILFVYGPIYDYYNQKLYTNFFSDICKNFDSDSHIEFWPKNKKGKFLTNKDNKSLYQHFKDNLKTKIVKNPYYYNSFECLKVNPSTTFNFQDLLQNLYQDFKDKIDIVLFGEGITFFKKFIQLKKGLSNEALKYINKVVYISASTLKTKKLKIYTDYSLIDFVYFNQVDCYLVNREIVFLDEDFLLKNENDKKKSLFAISDKICKKLLK